MLLIEKIWKLLKGLLVPLFLCVSPAAVFPPRRAAPLLKRGVFFCRALLQPRVPSGAPPWGITLSVRSRCRRKGRWSKIEIW